MSIERLVDAAVERHAKGDTSYARFVLELERAVDAAEDVQDPRAGALRRLWGDLEILNALRDGTAITSADEQEVAEVVSQVRAILAGNDRRA